MDKQLRRLLDESIARCTLLQEQCTDFKDRLKFSVQTVACLRKEIGEINAQLTRDTHTDTESHGSEEMTKFAEVAEYAQELEARLAVLETENTTLRKKNKRYKCLLEG